jgi:hypothetical protein
VIEEGADGPAGAARPPDLHPHNVVIDCADHDVVVPFWEAALGWTSRRVNDQFVLLRAPDDRRVGFDILFQKVPEPKTAKNRAHIDFDAGDRDAEVARLVGLGGASGRTTTWATSTGRSSPTPRATSSA